MLKLVAFCCCCCCFYSTERIDYIAYIHAEQRDDDQRQGAAHHLQRGGQAAPKGDLVQGRQVDKSQTQCLPIQASQVSTQKSSIIA